MPLQRRGRASKSKQMGTGDTGKIVVSWQLNGRKHAIPLEGSTSLGIMKEKKKHTQKKTRRLMDKKETNNTGGDAWWLLRRNKKKKRNGQKN